MLRHRHVPGRMLRRFAILGGLATLAAILYVAIASAWVQPVNVTVEWRSHRPEAGTVFTALVILTDNVPGACPQGTVGHRAVAPVRAAFNEAGSPSVSVCSYQIPRGPAGRELVLVGDPLSAPRKLRITPRP